MEFLSATCRAVLVVVFAAAVYGKARDLPGFARSLVDSRLVGSRWRTWAAAGILTAEAATVLLLLLPGRYGFAAASAVSAVLTAGVAVTVARGVKAPCLCFGASAEPLGPVHLARNAFLTCAGVLGLAAADSVAPAAWLTGAVVAVLLIRLDDLRSVFR